MVFQFHTDLMVQLVKDKTQVKYLKVKKWLVIWEISLRTMQNIEIVKTDLENEFCI